MDAQIEEIVAIGRATCQGAFRVRVSDPTIFFVRADNIPVFFELEVLGASNGCKILKMNELRAKYSTVRSYGCSDSPLLARERKLRFGSVLLAREKV
jgi:hypothetical protein